VLVIGAGEMATLVTRSLSGTAIADLRLVNRTPERAAALAATLDSPARHDGLTALGAHIQAADAVVSATASPDVVIDSALATTAGPTLFVDLAQPRDVAAEVGELETAAVHDLERLEAVTQATHEDRREAAEAVESLIEEEYGLLIDQYKRTRADAVISGMYRGAERIKRRELDTARSRLGGDGDPTPAEEEVLEEFADALVSQLLAVPTRSLREAAANDDWDTITSAIELFDPTDGDAHKMFEAVRSMDDSSADVSGDS
ncbi:MAG: glutamyl-tRNA reductase, partial [Halobacteriales archaeon]|nr:glutamyl-tRNA reductase [Halobacteriales archaeon]